MFNRTLIAIFISLLLISCFKQPTNDDYISPKCMDYQSQCSVLSSKGEIFVSFNVNTVKPEQHFQVSLHGEAVKHLNKVTGFLEGKEMYMGKIPLFFARSTENIYIADVLLGSCSDEKMAWRMWLSLSFENNNGDAVTELLFVDFNSIRS